MKKTVAIYNPYLVTKGGGEKVCLALAAALAQDPSMKVYMLTHEEIDVKSLEQYFNIDLSRVGFRFIDYKDKASKIINKLPLPGKLRNFFFDIKVSRQIKKHHYDVFINNCFQSNLPNPSPLGIYMCMFPQKITQTSEVGVIKKIYFWGVDVLYRIFLHPSHKNGIFSYQLITANSAYTQKYIQEYWNKPSEIIYPICEDMAKPGVKKRKIILNVGRFFENSGENHHKKQDFLLDTFTKMTNLHKDGWELHFAGSVAEDVGGLKYILELIKSGSNFPVFFHFNSSFDELKKLFNEATIYWHATGYGSSQKLHPEKQEHFGITTVEAMSAKAIPIVINTAGQKESVSQGENGYLWNTREELINFTEKVASLNESDLKTMQDKSVKTAVKYGKKAFDERVVSLFEDFVTNK